jgi:hypothetical protein
MCRWMLHGFTWRGRARSALLSAGGACFVAYQGKQWLGPDLRSGWWLLLYNPR